MTVENEVLPMFTWLFPHDGAPGAIIFGLGLVALLSVLGFLFGLMVAVLRHGPTEGLNVVARQIFDAFTADFPGFSLRRTWAISWLIIQESIRRSALAAFVVFVVVLLFAGLFLDTSNSDPARWYLSIVYFSINILLMLMGLFLSTFSLPADIKNRTIYTVVTKPVRSGELIFGRIVGFGLVGTVILLVMASFSYIFVVRGLWHTHTLQATDFTDIRSRTAGGESAGRQAMTSQNSHHQHKVKIDNEGNVTTEIEMGHWHNVQVQGEGDSAQYALSGPIGDLEAKVPVYGKMKFLDRAGKEKERGINQGDEWEYRSYIEGGTQSEVFWTFEGITRDRFPDGLPIEMTFLVFRTYKGNIERGVLGEILVRNPDPGAKHRSSAPIPFESKEFVTDSRLIPVKLKPLVRDQSGSGDNELDLFDDLVSPDGRVEIVLRCAEPAQYFGAAQADLYIRAADHPFAANFLKGCVGIWLQMIIIICFGVMFSTFLNGPVAMLATLSTMVMGFFGEFVRQVASGAVEGGGPIESTIRMITQANQQVDLEVNSVVQVIVKSIDFVIMLLMSFMTYFIPNYNYFSTSNYVENGYNIPPELMTQQILTGLTYIICASLVAYFCLKTREIAA